MSMVECPICLRDIEIDQNAKEGDVVQCPVCKAWFRLIKVNGQWDGERVR